MRVQRQINELQKLANPLGDLGASWNDIQKLAIGESDMIKRLSQIGAFNNAGIANLAKLQIAPRHSLAMGDWAKRFSLDRNVLSTLEFARPDLSALNGLAKHVVEIVEGHSRFSSLMAWESDLAARMKSLTASWALPEYAEGSAYAFAKLARLTDTVLRDAPYAPATRKYVEDELGEIVVDIYDDDLEAREQQYEDAGRDPALVAFPSGEYPLVLNGAGFDFQIPPPPMPQPIANSDGPIWFDDQETLRSLELHLRNFIVSQLSAISGPRWIIQRVPGDMRKRWKERQEEYRSRGQMVFDLIHYADFNDLAQLIGQTNNWNDAFKPIFGDKDGMQVSLRRLSPLRNNDGHCRPLGPTDFLYLASESVRLLRAIGVLKFDS